MAIRKILVPTDFSAPSRAALEYAAELAPALGASIDVLHVWELPVFVPPSMLPDAGVADLSVIDIYRKGAESQLEQFVAEAKEQGVAVRAAFAELGPPSQTIAEFANRREYDLIVIGTHGRTGLAHVVIGSVAERVVRYAHCPVLAVRAKKEQQAVAAE
jgi:universal stress protein A